MTRQVKVPAGVDAQQRKAADPGSSIWVSANAGSGKTHVLTMRVLRLLLSGVSPQSILCLTYTKAAAAEMRRRVSARLADWALAEDAILDRKLSDLDPAGMITQGLRERARTLFAHALETPGGLKIVTIHAFCESVLHRFPMEARVPIDFAVIEDDERARLVLAARESVLSDGLKGHPEVGVAVARLFATLSDHALTQAIDTALADGRKLHALLADREGAKQRLRRLVGFDGRSSDDILDEVVAGRLVGPAEIARVLAVTPPKGDGRSFEDKLARLDPQNFSAQGWLKTFLTAEQAVPKSGFPKKALVSAEPALAEALVAEAERLEGLCAALRRAALVERSEALLDVLNAIVLRYEAQKRARSRLDFDDLIERLGALFADPALGPWVQYKLDAGITHILVDESQDTNAEQWKVVQAIADEFFATDIQAERPRTLFAVGDEKQSIYSFQGADPHLFKDTGHDYGQRAKAARQAFDSVPLRASFRTLATVLAAVDAVSERDDIRAALLAAPGEPVHHDTTRSESGGCVVLWPPVQQLAEAADIAKGWPTAPAEAERTAPRQVAERIAGEIRGWIDSGRPLGPRNRPVTADDVLVLVQSRNALFHEIIRALRANGLPTPGADRLAVTTHIAVLDLLALGDVLLNPADDLQLAALLRSPLFEVSEDDLLALAYPRARGQTLWNALGAAKTGSCAKAYAALHRWRGQLDFERPFEFFAHILYGEGGLRRFHGRLGLEVDDVFAAFLDLALAHEQSAQPSLQGFLTTLRGQSVSIKRELAETGSGVRVMTVHGAKGLESPIVILADAATRPNAQKLGKPVYVVGAPLGPLLVHAGGKGDHAPQTLDLRDMDETNQRQEYWRKLYVGMTRAEDELYVTGALTPGSDAGKQIEGSWYEAIEQALAAKSDGVMRDDGTLEALVYPKGTAYPTHRRDPGARQDDGGGVDAGSAPLVLPSLPPHTDRLIVSPSSAHSLASIDRAFDTALDAFADAEAARKEGLALHALLQHLGRIPRAQRDLVLARAMPVLLPDAPERHAELAQKAVRLLDRPEFASLFGPDSRAEVPFAHDLLRNGSPVRLAGRIDRLVIESGRILIVDYKSDRAVPADASAIPPAYLTQLGLYALVASQLFPAHSVGAAILWTSLESLMIVPPDRLAAATASFTKE